MENLTKLNVLTPDESSSCILNTLHNTSPCYLSIPCNLGDPSRKSRW